MLKDSSNNRILGQLEVSEDGINYQKVCDLKPVYSAASGNWNQKTVSFPAGADISVLTCMTGVIRKIRNRRCIWGMWCFLRGRKPINGKKRPDFTLRVCFAGRDTRIFR